MISLHEGRGGAKAKGSAERMLALHLEVMGCAPRVWRRLVVRESMWLSRLHDSIQVAFDWYDYQSHVFAFDDLRFGNPVRRDELVVEDDRDVTLVDVDLAHRERFAYDYQFGEGWRVEVRIERVGPLEKKVAHPLCLAGERAGPPEDCGGIEAYHDMLACLQEPNTDLGREWREWLGPDYDPARCDLAEINRALRKLGK